MKKIISIVIIMLIMTIFSKAQNDSVKVFQKITGSFIFADIASTSFSGNKQPFELGVPNLLPTITIFTPKTYHMIRYGFGNNSLSSLNGYFLENGWDTYFIYSKTLSVKDNYLGVGIEKMIKINENEKRGVKYFLLTEIGTDLKGNQFLSFGFLINGWNQF
jgi:hypothetical protein